MTFIDRDKWIQMIIYLEKKFFSDLLNQSSIGTVVLVFSWWNNILVPLFQMMQDLFYAEVILDCFPG